MSSGIINSCLTSISVTSECSLVNPKDRFRRLLMLAKTTFCGTFGCKPQGSRLVFDRKLKYFNDQWMDHISLSQFPTILRQASVVRSVTIVFDYPRLTYVEINDLWVFPAILDTSPTIIGYSRLYNSIELFVMRNRSSKKPIIQIFLAKIGLSICPNTYECFRFFPIFDIFF